MAFKFEKRPYGPDSTEEEIRALRDICYVYKDDIVAHKEPPVSSVFAVDLTFEKFKEITADLASFYLLLDLTECARPDAEFREHLKKRLSEFKKIRHVAAFTGQNFLLNIAAQFVFSGNLDTSFSVHKTREEALEAIYAKKQG